MWINPIDKLPQIPQDWANHIIYGGLIGILLILFHISIIHSVDVVLLLGGFKKSVDYFKEMESLCMCICKTIIGALWPATFLLFK